MTRSRARSLTAAVGLLTAGLVLGGVPATYAAAPGNKHLPKRPGVAKIFPNLADGSVRRHQPDHAALLESRCDLYGTQVPVTWASTLSLSDVAPRIDVRIEVAKLRNKKTAKRVFKGYEALSTCKKTEDAGDVYRIRPAALPDVGQDRVGLHVRSKLSGSGEVAHVSMAVVRKGRKIVVASAERAEEKIPKKRIRKLAKLVARKL